MNFDLESSNSSCVFIQPTVPVWSSEDETFGTSEGTAPVVEGDNTLMIVFASVSGFLGKLISLI